MFRVYSPRVYNPMCKGGAWIIFVLTCVFYLEGNLTTNIVFYFIIIICKDGYPHSDG